MSFEGPIVVGIDGTGRAARACSWAASVAAATEQMLVVVHAYQVGDYPGGPDSAASAAKQKVSRWLSATDLGQLAEERVTLSSVSGHAGPVLVAMAAAEHASMLVLGAPHVGAVAPHGLGKIVQHTTFRSPVPVAIVRSPGGPVATSPVIVGLDPVDSNLEAVDWSFMVAGRLDTSLEVVAVSPSTSAVDALARLLDGRVSQSGPRVDLIQADGDPAHELMARAKEIDASAIVVGQKRRHSVGGRLLGHVPSKLIYQSSYPVILLPHT